MFLQLFEEVRNVLPLNFKGERRTLTSMGNINDNVINCNANQCFITWIEVKPFHLFGDNIQHCSDFFCDESILKNENDLDLFTETNSFTNLYVKRTLIKTEYVLPSLLKRRKVSNLSVIKLEIIQVELENVQKRKKQLDIVLIESKKFFETINLSVIQSFEKTLKCCVLGVKFTKKDIFGSLNLIDLTNSMFNDLEIFKFVDYETLFDALKDLYNSYIEGFAVSRDNSKYQSLTINLDILGCQLEETKILFTGIEEKLRNKKDLEEAQQI